MKNFSLAKSFFTRIKRWAVKTHLILLEEANALVENFDSLAKQLADNPSSTQNTSDASYLEKDMTEQLSTPLVRKVVDINKDIDIIGSTSFQEINAKDVMN